MPEVGEALLQVKRHRIVDGAADLLLGQASHDHIALPFTGHPDHVLVEDMVVAQSARGKRLRRQGHTVKEPRIREGLLVGGGICAAGRVPTIQERELGTQDGGLDGVDAEITAHHLVVVALLHAVVADTAQLLRHLSVQAERHAGVTGGTEILTGIEADVGGRRDDARGLGSRLGGILGAKNLGGILEDLDSECVGDRPDPVHVAAGSEEMNRDDEADAVALWRTEESVGIAPER